MEYITNGFSLQMLAGVNFVADARTVPCSEGDARKAFENGAKSIIGHADTAAVAGFPFNRETVSLNYGDVLYVCQLIGGRLPEGAKTLPEGFKLVWLRVEIRNPKCVYDI